MHPLVFVQYKFDRDEHEVRINPHGNRKRKSASYHRTMATTKERSKSIASTTKPSATILKDIEEAGGIKNVKSSGAIARNVRQAKYYRACGSSGHNTGEATDPLLEAIDSCKKENRDDKKFVLEVIAAPEFSILLASDQQLQ